MYETQIDELAKTSAFLREQDAREGGEIAQRLASLEKMSLELTAMSENLQMRITGNAFPKNDQCRVDRPASLQSTLDDIQGRLNQTHESLMVIVNSF